MTKPKPINHKKLVAFDEHLSLLSERRERNKKPPAMRVEDNSFSFKQNKTSYDKIVLPDKLHILTKEFIILMDNNSLSHTQDGILNII